MEGVASREHRSSWTDEPNSRNNFLNQRERPGEPPTIKIQLHDPEISTNVGQNPPCRRRVAKSLSLDWRRSNSLAVDHDPGRKEDYHMTISARRLGKRLRELSLGTVRIHFSPLGDDTTDDAASAAAATEKLDSLSSVLASSAQSTHGTQRLFIREQLEQEWVTVCICFVGTILCDVW